MTFFFFFLILFLRESVSSVELYYGVRLCVNPCLWTSTLKWKQAGAPGANRYWQMCGVQHDNGRQASLGRRRATVQRRRERWVVSARGNLSHSRFLCWTHPFVSPRAPIHHRTSNRTTEWEYLCIYRRMYHVHSLTVCTSIPRYIWSRGQYTYVPWRSLYRRMATPDRRWPHPLVPGMRFACSILVHVRTPSNDV